MIAMAYGTITSRANPRLKHLKKLIDDRDYRAASGEYAVEGVHALEGMADIRELFVADDVAVPAVNAGQIFVVARAILDQITPTENSQGVVAIAGCTVRDANALNKDARYVLLDRLQDPGNMGTIARACCAFGFQGLIVTPGCVDPFAPKVVRAAAGAVGKLDIIRIASLHELQGHTLIVADRRGQDVGCFAWPGSFILVIGNEGGGPSKEARLAATATVAIPMSGCMESLNAAIAAGILLYCATQKPPATS